MMLKLKEWDDYEAFILDVTAAWRDVVSLGVGSIIYWQRWNAPNPLSGAAPGEWGNMEPALLLTYTPLLVKWATANCQISPQPLSDLSAAIVAWALGSGGSLPVEGVLVDWQTKAENVLASIEGKAQQLRTPAAKPAAMPAALTAKVSTAWEQYKTAKAAIQASGEKATDPACFRWWAAKDDEEERIAADEETWKRNVRKARKALGEQKNTPRGGRVHGSGIIRAKKGNDRIRRD